MIKVIDSIFFGFDQPGFERASLCARDQLLLMVEVASYRLRVSSAVVVFFTALTADTLLSYIIWRGYRPQGFDWFVTIGAVLAAPIIAFLAFFIGALNASRLCGFLSLVRCARTNMLVK